MQQVLGVALHAMQQDAAKLDRVASNLANVLTPGFKREVLVQRAASDVALFGQAMMNAQAQTAAERSSDSFEVRRDERPGTLKPTGNPFDVALTGAGYFEVATHDGPAFTRQGQFTLDTRSRLVHIPSGNPVMGIGGEIVLGSGPFSIDASGQITQGDRPVGQIKVVLLPQGGAAQSRGDGLIVAASHTTAIAENGVSMRQGYVENANVSAAHEMVQLSQAVRHFESMQRIAQGYDDMLSTAIRKLGDL